VVEKNTSRRKKKLKFKYPLKEEAEGSIVINDKRAKNKM